MVRCKNGDEFLVLERPDPFFTYETCAFTMLRVDGLPTTERDVGRVLTALVEESINELADPLRDY